MLNLKNKIPFLKDKTIDEYNETILMPSFNMMEIYRNAKDVEIDINDYKKIIKNTKNTNSHDNNYRVMKMINQLKKTIFDEEFLNKIITKIFFVVNYGKYSITNKSFVGNLKIDNKEYKFGLEISFKSITYALEYSNTKVRGKISIEKDTVNIKYEKYNHTITKQPNKTFYNIDNNIRLDIYNKFGEQKAGMIKTQKYNYYKDINGNKKVLKIDSNNNYTKQVYRWKCPNNSIIKSVKVKYQYPKDISNLSNIDKYYIGKNISPNNNKIPSKGKFYEIDKSIFLDYCSNKCDINNLWEETIDYKKIK